MKKLIFSLVFVSTSIALVAEGDSPTTSPNKNWKQQKARGAQAYERKQAFKHNPRQHAQRTAKKLTFGKAYKDASPKK